MSTFLRYCQSCGRGLVSESCRCKATILGPEPPFFARVHCRTCGVVTRWQRSNLENGRLPPVLTWRCSVCSSSRYQYADCTNVETMCITVMEENLRRTGANVDHDEAIARLVFEAWRLYLGWRPFQDPDRPPVNFEGYAYNILRRRANDIYRQMLGRNGEKPLANAVSLDTGPAMEERAVVDGESAFELRVYLSG